MGDPGRQREGHGVGDTMTRGVDSLGTVQSEDLTDPGPKLGQCGLE